MSKLDVDLAAVILRANDKFKDNPQGEDWVHAMAGVTDEIKALFLKLTRNPDRIMANTEHVVDFMEGYNQAKAEIRKKIKEDV